jgi:hypothetical protein
MAEPNAPQKPRRLRPLESATLGFLLAMLGLHFGQPWLIASVLTGVLLMGSAVLVASENDR